MFSAPNSWIKQHNYDISLVRASRARFTTLKITKQVPLVGHTNTLCFDHQPCSITHTYLHDLSLTKYNTVTLVCPCKVTFSSPYLPPKQREKSLRNRFIKKKKKEKNNIKVSIKVRGDHAWTNSPVTLLSSKASQLMLLPSVLSKAAKSFALSPPYLPKDIMLICITAVVDSCQSIPFVAIKKN